MKVFSVFGFDDSFELALILVENMQSYNPSCPELPSCLSCS